MIESETLPEASEQSYYDSEATTKENELHSGFEKPLQEELYDQLTCKLVELLCDKLLSNPSTRESLLAISVNAQETKNMTSWVKKIVKIFQVMLALEYKKTTKPLVSLHFANLI